MDSVSNILGIMVYTYTHDQLYHVYTNTQYICMSISGVYVCIDLLHNIYLIKMLLFTTYDNIMTCM